MNSNLKRPTRPAKIADVARVAGVSVATISRALANPGVVSPETRARVMEAVRQTGYTPNAAARNLRARTTMMALVVVPDLANPFFAEVLRGIDKSLSASGYGLIIGNLDNSAEKEARYVDFAFAGQVDGVLLLCGHVPSSKGRSMLDTNLPVVAACERIVDARLPLVEVDNRAAAVNAVNHLIGLGHRRIGYISGPSSNVLDQERQRGYGDALRAAGIPADPGLVFHGDFSFRSGAAAATAVLALPEPQRPTAIFAANDEMAIGFLKTVHAAGHRVPRDFSVVGFDAIDYADYCEPTLTTVFQPRREIGERVADLLVSAMKSPENPVPALTVLETALLVRQSTGRPRS